MILTSSDLDSANNISTTTTPVVPGGTASYPSSNDTGLLVLKPAVVNLGSQSSKCTEIHTPTDPSKLSLIDNKRMSIIIGCISGLVVFACIIVSIVSNNNKEKEGESDNSVPDNHSVSGSQAQPFKSPATVSKGARSDSLAYDHRINSQVKIKKKTPPLTWRFLIRYLITKGRACG